MPASSRRRAAPARYWPRRPAPSPPHSAAPSWTAPPPPRRRPSRPHRTSTRPTCARRWAPASAPSSASCAPPARKEAARRKLTDEESVALNAYTRDDSTADRPWGYRAINSALRSNDRETLRAALPFARTIDDALAKFPDHKGVVRRGFRLRKEELADVAHWTEGAQIRLHAFTSTSKKEAFEGNVQMTIRSKSGKVISPLSASPGEQEVLMRRGLEYRVLRRRDTRGGVQVDLEEIGMPPTDDKTEAARQARAAREDRPSPALRRRMQSEAAASLALDRDPEAVKLLYEILPLPR